MADDVTLPGTGVVIAADEISSKQYQRIKLISGADGSNDGDIDDACPLPVYPGHKLVRPGNLTFLPIVALNTSGNNSLVAASGSLKIRIYAYLLKVKGAVDVKFRDSVASADYCPIMNFLAAGDGVIQDYMGFPYFISAAAADLKLNLSAGVEVNGWVLYSQEA